MEKGLNLVIEADWNDGDILTEITPITSKELKKIKPILKKDMDDWDEDEYEEMRDYLPMGYPDGAKLHTITEAKVVKIDVVKTENLL